MTSLVISLGGLPAKKQLFLQSVACRAELAYENDYRTLVTLSLCPTTAHHAISSSSIGLPGHAGLTSHPRSDGRWLFGPPETALLAVTLQRIGEPMLGPKGTHT